MGARTALTAHQQQAIESRPVRHRPRSKGKPRTWSADEFKKSRGRILSADRSDEWKRRALRQLVKESGAEVQQASHKVVGYRMPGGDVACTKLRFSSGQAARDALATCQGVADHISYRRERRVYWCHHCRGWHLTSEQ